MSARRSVLALLALLSIASTSWAQITPDLRRLIGRPQRELIAHLGAPTWVDQLHGGRIALNYRGLRYQRYQPPCSEPVRRYDYVTVPNPRGRGLITVWQEVVDPPVCPSGRLLELRCSVSVFVDRTGTVSAIIAVDWPCPPRTGDIFEGIVPTQ